MNSAPAPSPPPEVEDAEDDDYTPRPRPTIGLHRASFRAPAQVPPPPPQPQHERAWRRLLGLGLLGCVVFLWTASGFLQSAIYADDTYSKPYFVTYVNTAFFALPVLPVVLGYAVPKRARKWVGLRVLRGKAGPTYTRLGTDDAYNDDDVQHTATSSSDILRTPGQPQTYDTNTNTTSPSHHHPPAHHNPPLTIRQTFNLSLRFSLLWFIANYANAACLHYTTVSSSTILSTTSSVFTLAFGALTGVEPFSSKKLGGVLACLAGVALISLVDVGGDGGDRGSFPDKTRGEVAWGDTLALGSAVLYGLYCVLLVKTIGDESRVRMPIFFGFLGLINILAMWPGLLLLHFTGIETFQLPPTGRVWLIVILNAGSSLVADLCWAYAMLFTSPLVVTVGLSLTIPLAMVGQMLIEGMYSSGLYWVGAVVVVLSFVFINRETAREGVGKEAGLEDEDEDDYLRRAA